MWWKETQQSFPVLFYLKSCFVPRFDLEMIGDIAAPLPYDKTRAGLGINPPDSQAKVQVRVRRRVV